MPARRAEAVADTLEGQDAVAAIALVLTQALQGHSALRRYSDIADLPAFVEEVQSFLANAFEGGVWPRFYITSEVVDCPQFEGFVNVILDAVRLPAMANEQDLLLASMRHINKNKISDRRVQRFFEQINDFAAPEEGPRDPSPNPQDGEDQEGDFEIEEDEEEDTGKDFNTTTLEEFRLPPQTVAKVQAVWDEFRAVTKTQQAAGHAIYSALFDASPSLQGLFNTPKAVQAIRFMLGIDRMISLLSEPKALQAQVEALGFGHLQIDVTVPRAIVFRDAILSVLTVECGDAMSLDAFAGLKALLNYIGGALIFCRAHFAPRLQLLKQSWALANVKEKEAKEKNPDEMGEDNMDAPESNETSGQPPEQGSKEWRVQGMLNRFRSVSKGGDVATKSTEAKGALEAKGDSPRDKADDVNLGLQGVMSGLEVPKTFEDMFLWNAGVTGVRQKDWHMEVLSSFDIMVRNITHPGRFEEECNQLALRISKVSEGTAVELAEFKNLMLAALRSLLPKVWDSTYEVAWTWLWNTIQRLLLAILGSPPVWEQELECSLRSLDEAHLHTIRGRAYDRFFELCLAGQEFFNQSDTRLHYIMNQVIEMSLQMYKDPWGVVEELSALGLRHVGYGVPTEHLGPFVTATVETFASATESEKAHEAFRWSLGLICTILVRTIIEGSTIVMKAVNANSEAMLKKAISTAPRGERAEWMLNIQVGTQKISPLSWAIESGSLRAATAILKDLLTIRADRTRYYYGVDQLFSRHEDIVGRLVEEAPSLLPVLFEGLVWRSKQSKDGLRRVNYYVRHLIVDDEGLVAEGLGSMAKATNAQKIISHPVIVLVSDTLWSGVVKRQFILSKLGFLCSLLVFMLSQAILPKTGAPEHIEVRAAIFTGRMITYGFSMTRMMFSHSRRWAASYREGKTFRFLRIPLPNYLRDFYGLSGFVLALLLAAMCGHEPMFWCIGSSDQWPTEVCPAAEMVEDRYLVISMCAMMLHWLLVMDMAVFATKLSAFVLVVKHVLSEVGRFFIAMLFLLVAFGSAITCLRHGKREFRDVPSAANCLFAITVGLYEGDFREYTDSPWLLFAMFLFVTLSVIVLLNLLIAQLNCSYEYVYADMLGFARLTRATLIVNSLRTCPLARWSRFVSTLRFDQKVEFDEGDVGLSGALQIQEPASLNPVLIDRIIRYGGTCSSDMQWPADAGQDEDERFEKVEHMMKSALKKLVGPRPGRRASVIGIPVTDVSGADSAFSGPGRQESPMTSGADDMEPEDSSVALQRR